MGVDAALIIGLDREMHACMSAMLCAIIRSPTTTTHRNPIPRRIDERIETVIEDGRLERAKVEKHRECWPTAFYERSRNGEPIFVDRMGILGAFLSTLECTATDVYVSPFHPSPSLLCNTRTDLNRLKKSLTMEDMVTYYVQTMEARRRILFPHLSRRTGQLVTQVRLPAFLLCLALRLRSIRLNKHALVPFHPSTPHTTTT